MKFGSEGGAAKVPVRHEGEDGWVTDIGTTVHPAPLCVTGESRTNLSIPSGEVVR